MIDTRCPNCGAEMQFLIMEVVEFWDSGYKLHAILLRFYHCEECACKKGVKHCDFVLFKNGEIYGFEGDKWAKIVIIEKVDFT